LISSGSMVITCNDGRALVNELNKNGIDAELIGKVTKEMNRVLYVGNKVEVINEPESDELFKII